MDEIKSWLHLSHKRNYKSIVITNYYYMLYYCSNIFLLLVSDVDKALSISSCMIPKFCEFIKNKNEITEGI